MMLTLTVRHTDGWAYLCPTCGATEAGFALEHYARTIGDEHRLTHVDDLDGGSQLTEAPPAPAPRRDLVAERQMILGGL